VGDELQLRTFGSSVSCKTTVFTTATARASQAGVRTDLLVARFTISPSRGGPPTALFGSDWTLHHRARDRPCRYHRMVQTTHRVAHVSAAVCFPRRLPRWREESTTYITCPVNERAAGLYAHKLRDRLRAQAEGAGKGPHEYENLLALRLGTYSPARGILTEPAEPGAARYTVWTRGTARQAERAAPSAGYPHCDPRQEGED